MASLDQKCKKCRRTGEKLFLKGEKCASAKCPMVKRTFPPGAHGAKGYRRLTNYGEQLKEKQKAKRIYGLREKQFYNYFVKAFKKVGNTGELLFGLLESRLDNVVYRLGLARSRAQARQLVSHGAFAVNGKKVNIPSYLTRVGEEISVRPTKAAKKPFSALAENEKSGSKEMVSWLTFDAKNLTGKITGQPRPEEAGANIDWRVIVEFYSK